MADGITAHETRPPDAPARYRLRIPGPAEVPERVRQAAARTVLNHRGPEFRAQLAYAEAGVRPILGTANRVMFFAASGSGMMEAALVNVVAPDAALLVVVQGQFGERFEAIGRALGARVDRLDVPWGESVDPQAIADRIRHTAYTAVVLVHNESSTGVVSDLAAIGAVLRDSPALLVVDTVSGLGGVEMRQDEWGIDVVVAASQKALMCPPGLGLASLSAKAWEVVNRPDRMARFYWDFRRALDSAEKSETPFTPPVSLVGGLCEALAMIAEEGLPQVLDRHRRLSAMLRAGGHAMGLGVFPRAPMLSNTVTVFSVPEQLEGGQIVRAMYERHRTVIAGARNRLSGRVIRIGTMGAIDEATILTDLAQLEDVLRHLGWPVAPGAGLVAAMTCGID
jgi:aspartate aminotransferase-like enzyme